jgi:hypothetical protein
MATEMRIYDRVPDPVAFCRALGRIIAASRMFQVANVQEAELIAWIAYTEGKSILEVYRTYHFINGIPSMRADRMLAEFRVLAGAKHELIEASPEQAKIKVTYDGTSYEFSLTWEEAQKEKWPWKKAGDHSLGFKDNWAAPLARADMLWVRCASRMIRKLCPEIVAGVYTPEEVVDDRIGQDNQPIVIEVSPEEVKTPVAETATAATSVEEAMRVAKTVLPAPPAEEQIAPFDDSDCVCTGAQGLKILELKEAIGYGDHHILQIIQKLYQKDSTQLLSCDEADDLIRRLELKKAKTGGN